MKKLSIIVVLCLVALSAGAQWKWINPMDAGFSVIQSQGFTDEIGKTYVRLPDRAKDAVRKDVWDLSRHSAGLAIYFYSNAPTMQIRYQVAKDYRLSYGMSHMPATGVSGVDLYSINSDGKWNIRTDLFNFTGDTIVYTYTHLGRSKYHKLGDEFRIYLPLYNNVKWLEIGVPDSSNVTFIPTSKDKPIVVYGTSIAHGACASRPAMAWTNILQRRLDFPVINLGFSGNGRLEKEVLNFIFEIDAKAYILDCLPNMTRDSKEYTRQHILDAAHQLRSRHYAPIILVENDGYSNAETDTARVTMTNVPNQACKEAYKILKDENFPDLYYVSREDIGMGPDSWVDNTHPSDVGMTHYADAIEKVLREALHIPIGNIYTEKPITQRREPGNYEWQQRHRDILARLATVKPKNVIIGNSITNYWGGLPKGARVNGPKSWQKYFEPRNFQNLGYGWDRVENVLWRIYHGELDGYTADNVYMMIGTNNLGLNSDEDIVKGIEFLISAIKQRQPKAKITIIGILPRRDREKWVVNINSSIEDMVKRNGCTFCDAGGGLLKADGKIDESLFVGDGLHPNDNGYEKIAQKLFGTK